MRIYGIDMDMDGRLNRISENRLPSCVDHFSRSTSDVCIVSETANDRLVEEQWWTLISTVTR